MGCSNSSIAENTKKNEKSRSNLNLNAEKNENETNNNRAGPTLNMDGIQASMPLISSKRVYQSQYLWYEFATNNANKCLILYNSPIYQKNEFLSFSSDKVEKKQNSQYKSSNHGIAVSYLKGLKLETVNQDKFFIIIDNNFEVYCLIDGHGPYGHIIAQIVQDKTFSYFARKLDKQDFIEHYETELKNLFNSINQIILKREVKEYTHYDPFLSGVAITIIVRIGEWLFHANIGNILGYVFYYDKWCPSKYNWTLLGFNDSNFDSKTLESGDIMKFETNPEKTSINYWINPNEINNEIRRVYEHGGETRQLSGEIKSRIFIKGKYFPGMINTRTIGDQIGNGIGCICEPHITKIHLKREWKYYWLICSDGVNNVLNYEKWISIIQSNDMWLLESINNITSESLSKFRAHWYSPDMTVVLKEIKVADDI